MANRKLTISISDELHEMIEPYRNEMNISKICANALKTEIHKREVFREVTSDMSKEIVDKMKKIDPNVDVSGI